MIKKSLLVSIILFIVWSLVLKIKYFRTSQHQLQSNMIAAEIFIFDTDTVTNLILGSSLAAELKMDSLPKFTNLSLAGQSVFDGLSILKARKQLPRNVFIEMNVLIRGENDTFKGIITSPILNTLKLNAAFRTDKQPLAILSTKILIPIVQSMIKDTKPEVKIKTVEKVNSDTKKSAKKVLNDKFYKKMFDIQKKSCSEPTNIDLINKNFEILHNHINYLKSKGTKITFFEMPINHELVNLEKPVFLRKKVKEEFPECGFIPIPQNTEIYITNDGIHLKKNEAMIYTSYLKKEIAKIID